MDSDDTGASAKDTSAEAGGDTGNSSKRWSSVQCKEFRLLHAVCARLILSCDLSSLADATGESDN